MKKYFPLVFFIGIVLWVNGCARIPKSPISPAWVGPPGAVSGITHTVERGQTLYRISKIYNVDVAEIMRLNGIYSPSRLEPGQKIFIPQAALPGALIPPYAPPVSLQQVMAIVGPKHPVSVWETITVHHSGTTRGNARLFDRDHRRRKMGGLFYHFVIGNGSSTADGAIEVGWRWKKQVKANRPFDIQICLVGNFDQQQVSEAQLNSLAGLITVLRQEYGIPVKGIRKHCDIPGKHTDCPGRYFPFDRLLSKVAENSRRFY